MVDPALLPVGILCSRSSTRAAHDAPSKDEQAMMHEGSAYPSRTVCQSVQSGCNQSGTLALSSFDARPIPLV